MRLAKPGPTEDMRHGWTLLPAPTASVAGPEMRPLNRMPMSASFGGAAMGNLGRPTSEIIFPKPSGF